MWLSDFRDLLPADDARQPKIVIGTWRAVDAEEDDVAEYQAREALLQLDPLRDELFPAEQARIVQLLVEHIRVYCVKVRPAERARGAGAGSSGSRRAAA